MNEVVDEYQQISDARIASLLLIEAIFLGISCLVFLLEFFIVVPKILKALWKAGRELKDETESAEMLVRFKHYSKIRKGLTIAN
jgi:hypothetical protein